MSSITPILSLFAILLLAGLVACAAAVALIAIGILRPPRMNDGKALYYLNRLTPSDLGLSFEDLAFTIRDDLTGRPLRLASWWIPAEHSSSGRTVVLLHDYADAKIGAIAWAPLWHELGFHVLALDLRAHGDSGGRESTAGFRERHDIVQVIDQLRAERPDHTRQVVVCGEGLGAAVALAAAALPEEHSDSGRIAAVVLLRPFADFHRIASGQMEYLGLPAGRIRRAGLRLAEWLSKSDFDAVRPTDLIRKSTVPLLAIIGADVDPTGDRDLPSVEKAISMRPGDNAVGRYVQLASTGADSMDDYRVTLREFIEMALPAAGGSAEHPRLGFRPHAR